MGKFWGRVEVFYSLEIVSPLCDKKIRGGNERQGQENGNDESASAQRVQGSHCPQILVEWLADHAGQHQATVVAISLVVVRKRRNRLQAALDLEMSELRAKDVVKHGFD